MKNSASYNRILHMRSGWRKRTGRPAQAQQPVPFSVSRCRSDSSLPFCHQATR